ncbi:low temperature requirement protein A [Leifsonia sp. EB34]|uniref:low temperature requirement protein A n=1 Tax=Leifsonia sp. EB34 TaxID=3156303 RepID=UPI003514698C
MSGVTGGRIARVASRVSTIELLFDLVFVFTIGQLTAVIVQSPGVDSVLRAAAILAVVWWMYDAFAWLTNQAVPDTVPVRVLLIAAMAAFLVLSLAIPDVFTGSGVLFGVAYLTVVIIHSGLFIARGGRGSVRVMLRVGPLNAVAALLLIASGYATGWLEWALFLAPLPLFLVSGLLARSSPFAIGASHFVERHGLLMIIAFGESIVSVGAGLTASGLRPQVVLGAVATVAMVASLWWCYFSGDDERAERSFGRASGRRGTTLALTAYYVAHFVMLFGLVGVAAGLHLSLADAFSPVTPAAAWLLSGGVAVYLVGDAEYRRELRLGPWAYRLIGAAGSLAAGLLAAWMLPLRAGGLPGIALIGALVAIVVLVLVAERAPR